MILPTTTWSKEYTDVVDTVDAVPPQRCPSADDIVNWVRLTGTDNITCELDSEHLFQPRRCKVIQILTDCIRVSPGFSQAFDHFANMTGMADYAGSGETRLWTVEDTSEMVRRPMTH